MILKPKWILLGATWSLIGITALLLGHLRSHQKLGSAGVKLQPSSAPTGFEIALPDQVGGYLSDPVAITDGEVAALPKDTIFGRRVYHRPSDLTTNLVSVVLMGTDRTSIHKPQYCLRGQGWVIDKSEVTAVPMSAPHRYALPVMKLLTSRPIEAAGGGLTTLRGIYAYWFVEEDHLTPRHAQRMWWMARDLIQKGVLQRWAYVTVFTVCAPGEEEKAFEQMKDFISQAVPEFQLAAGPERAPESPLASANP